MMELNIKTKVDISNAEKATDSIEKGAKKSETAVSSLTNQLDKMTGGAISGFKGMVSGIKNGVTGLKTFKGALAATGIGLLITAVGSLVTYFTQTERGAEKLKVITAALGGVIGSVTDRVVAMGEYLFEAFNNPKQALEDLGESFTYYFTEFIPNAVQKVIDGLGLMGKAIGLLFEGEFSEAADVAAEGFVKIVDGATDLNPVTAVIKSVTEEVVEMGKAAIITAEKAGGLEKRMNALVRAERDLGVERANSRSLVKELNKDAEDTTLSYQERAKAARRATEIEQGLLAKQVAAAAERVAIIKEQNALSESSAEDIQKLADAEIALANIRTESLEMQTTLQNKLNILEQQREAEGATKVENKRLEAIKEADNELREYKLEQEELELQRLLEFYARQRELELQALDLTEADKEAIRLTYKEKEAKMIEELSKKSEEAAKKDEEQEKAKVAMKKSLADQSLQLIQEAAGKGSKIAKGAAVAQAIISGIQGVQSAFTAANANIGATAGSFGAYPIAMASAAGAFSALQIKKILSTSTSGGGGSAPSVSSGGSGGSAAPTVPDFSFVNQGIGGTDNASIPTPRAYVVNQDIKDQSALDSRINDLAKI